MREVMAQSLRFGELEVRPIERQVLVGGRPAALQAKAFDLLVALIERRERIVSRAELYDTVWAGRVVEDGNLSVQVHALRRLLGERSVVTVPGRGYRFVLAAGMAPPPPPAHAVPPAGAPPAADALHAAPPVPATALHGREDDLATIDRLLAQHRLVSIVGPGGVGKTAVALAATHARRHAEPGGAVWIELAQLLDPALLPSTVARAFGLALAGADPVRTLAAALAPVRALLVLDNAEHVVEAVAELSAALLAKASGVRLLVTSQVKLEVDGECVLRLGALAVPEAGTALAEAEAFGAVALFAEAARAADRRFALTEANIATVVELCRRLDGIPLAIKLAAARLPFLGLNGLAARLALRLDLIGGSRRDAPTRQQTLAAALDWSHGLASASEQVVFRRLGVFVGGFTLELAAEVAGDGNDRSNEGLDGSSVVELLAALVDRSLVEAGESDPPRYRLLESAREYALVRLEAAGETTRLRQRHAEAVAAWMERQAAAAMTLGDDDWLAEAGPELDNVRAALDRCAQHDAALAVALTGASYRLFLLTNLLSEYRRRSSAIAGLLTPDIAPAVAGRYWVTRAQMQAGHDYPAMHEFAAKAVALLRAAGDRRGLHWALSLRLWSGRVPADEAARVADEAQALESTDMPARMRALGHLGRSQWHRFAGRPAEAARELDLALAHARAAGSDRSVATAMGLRAQVHYSLGEFDAGVRLMRHSAARERRRYGFTAHALSFLALGLVLQGERAEARQVLAEFFRHSRAADWWLFNVVDEAYCLLAMQEGRRRTAARLLGYSEHKARQITGIRMAEAQTRRARAQLDETLGAASVAQLLDEGARLDQETVCALTLEEAEG
jgi:predicted ATPase/DNA-binding winged helix-turn-helix (wHTH) protein